MTFDYEQKEFPSAVHQAIWNCIRNLFPLEKSLQNINEEPMRSDCISYYRCFRETYEDMYEHPEQYCIPVDEITQALKGAVYRKAIVAAKIHKDKQRQQVLNLIERIHLLGILQHRLIQCMQIEPYQTDGCIMPLQDGQKFIQLAAKKMQLKPNELLALYQKRGFDFTFDNEYCYLQNIKYPGVLRIMMKWRDTWHLLKSKPNHYGNPFFAACEYADFRALLPDYLCSFEDAITPMYEDQKRLLRVLDDALQEMKIRPKCSIYSASYVKKGKQILAYSGNYKHLDGCGDERYCRVPLVQYPSEEHLLFVSAVQEHPDAEQLIDFIFRHLILCRRCGCVKPHSVLPPAMWGRPTPLFGKTKRLCAGNVILGFSNLQENDIPLIMELIRIKYGVMQRNNRKV